MVILIITDVNVIILKKNYMLNLIKESQLFKLNKKILNWIQIW